MTIKGKKTLNELLSGETEEQTQPRREVFCLPGPLHTLIIPPPGLYNLAQNLFGKLLEKHRHWSLNQLEKMHFPKHLERHKNGLKKSLEVVLGSGLRQASSFGFSCSALTCPSKPHTFTPLT